MNLRVLDLAEADLLAGFRFYERKSRGVGWYFLDSLAADIESLHLYAGVHRRYLGYFRKVSRRFAELAKSRSLGDLKFEFFAFPCGKKFASFVSLWLKICVLRSPFLNISVPSAPSC